MTDAVYSNVYYPSYYENYEQHPMPLLALVQGQESNRTDGFEERYTVAAADGSWVMEETFRALSTSKHGLLLFGDDTLTVTDTFGKVTQKRSYQEMGLSDGDVENMISSLMWGGDPSGHRSGDRIAINWVEDDTYENIRYYDLSTGETGEMAWDEFDALDACRAKTMWSRPTPSRTPTDLMMKLLAAMRRACCLCMMSMKMALSFDIIMMTARPSKA